MELKFNPDQDFQLEAIKAVVNIFAGQKKQDSLFTINNSRAQNTIDGTPQTGYANELNITVKNIYNNVKNVQRDNNIEAKIDDENSKHFNIEMETGTGKTYVYLRTIFELNKQYGFNKFCIVVPSVAIRAGVEKSIQMMHKHFMNMYNNVDYKYFVYDSNRLTNLRNFAISNSLQIMIINIDSFNKKDNNINNFQDAIQGEPIKFIRDTKPIIIMDEPQNMKSDNAKNAIDSLNPLCIFRYSATHIERHNPLYILNAVDAYNRRLVKTIEVASVVSSNSHNTAYIKLLLITNKDNCITAKIEVDKDTKSGIKRSIITVRKGDDLEKKSNLKSYEGYIIDDIYNGDTKYINFTNKEDIIYMGNMIGDVDSDKIKYRQIYKIIEIHMQKQLELKLQEIKVLSLFFIDRVANYRSDGETKGKYYTMFEKAFAEILNKNPKYQELFNIGEIAQYHNGYFSRDKRGYKDTAGNTSIDKDTYKLIMQDKEELLSFKSKLQFIFSHSALREGWDNPNVFQICTLNETHSTIKKRQEIGRGLRLCVNQSGDRIFNNNVNILTIVANESYDDFAKNLQTEISNDTGLKFDTKNIKKHGEQITLKINKQLLLSDDFRELWDKIKLQTRYTINYETADLIQKCKQYFIDNPLNIQSIKIDTTTHRIKKIDSTGLQVDETSITKKSYHIELENLAVPDIISYLQNRVYLNRKTIVDILINSGQLEKFKINPQLFMDEMVNIINQQKQSLLIDGVAYFANGECYDQSLFESEEIKGYINNDLLELSKEEQKYPYDYVKYDSKIEEDFAKDCNNNESVKIFAKLPYWFKVQTPIGSYNPDWAILIEKDNMEKLYFVVETKSTTNKNELRDNEKQKISCGKKHFKTINKINALQYKVIDKLEKIL